MKAPDIEDLYTLSPMQEGMLFHHLYSPQSDIYFRQQSYTFHGPLNVAAFTRAWDRVIERHAVLRASFFWQDLEKPLQVVRRIVAPPLEHHDWRGLPETEQDERLKALLSSEHSKGFDIARAPLMRVVIVQVADEVSHFIWSYHHLLMDGWSKYHVLREVVSLYDAFCEGKDLSLGRSRPYRDYISWLKQQDKSGAEAFWREALKGFKAPTPIGGNAQDDSRSNAESEYKEREVWLTAEATSALKTLARQHQFTLNTLVQAAWSLLLSRYSGEEDVLFGITVSGRPAALPGVESMVGLFINTLPLRVRVPHDAELLPWLKTLQAQQAELIQFEHSPLSDVHGWSEVPRSQMLFESILVFDNFPVDPNVRVHRELRFTPLASVERNNYPLTLVAFADERLMLRIPYDTQRFESAAIDRMLGHLQSLLAGMAANPHQRLCEVPLITREERERLLSDLDNTRHHLAHDLTVHELFEAQAERTPEATAVKLGPESLNYRELNERANQLAHHLRELGVGPEVRVGICAERSIEMLVGLLGILKAGGVYVPLDPSFPQERLSYLLEDLEVPVLLTQDHLLFELPPYAAASQIVCLDSDWGAISSCSSENPENVLTGDNLAYIIYTSGSTGTPKGVCIPHGVAANHFLTAQREFCLDSTDVVLEFASFNFDVSLEQIFVPLLAGATLVLRDARTWGREDFFQHAAEYGLTVVNFPPAYWTQVVPAPGSEIAAELAARLKLVIIGGDQMQPSTARMWQQAGLRDVRLLNAYGPTETTITATAFEVPLLADGDEAQMPIGRPLAQRAIYILDQQGSVVPVEVTGEMHIGGPLLARGYLNRPGLTAEKFIPDPFSTQPGARMYRTGDQVALSEDRNIRFLGRADQQVKIRGYRIELGEIEAAMYACEGVRDAVVIVTEQLAGEKKLIGYLVWEAGATAASADKVRERLRERLPEYMIPSAFVVLEEMPLTPNGKVDRRALPAPDEARARDVDDYQAPRTPIEEMLVNIFGGVLDVERVGVEDNFFELGGHSLLVTQVISRIRESLNVELPVRAVFEYPTVAALAGQVEAESRAGHEAAPPLVRRGSVGPAPLSFAQARLWFLDQFEPGSSAYNMPFALRLKGALDVDALERAMTEIVRRHEVLRTRFAIVEGEPVQVVDEPAAFVLPVVQVEGLEPHVAELIQAEASQPFDLETGPLVRARLVRVSDLEHVLLFTMHHIVSDGWSMGVLMREVGALYNAYSEGAESPLEELPIQYADYAVWQREWLQGEALERQLDYWRRQLADAPAIELPTEKTRPAVLSPASARAEVRLSAEAVAGLRELGRREGCTLFMTLLAALQIVLWRYTGQSELVVGTPVANRGQGGTEELIGFFVNTLALRTALDEGLTFRELLSRVRETCLGAYAHQDVPFEKLVEELGVRRELNRNPLFDVMLALQGADNEGLRLEGLDVSAEAAGTAVGAKFDLLLGLVEERDGGVRGKLEYREELFGAALMRRMAARVAQVVQEAAASKGESRLNELGLVTEEERDVQLAEWNTTARDYDLDVCLHQLFEQQTSRTPDATALISEGERLTYRELNARANRLTHRLNALGVGPETLVGLLFERSTELVVSLLAVLKAGGAYLPLDPTYPAARLRYMFEDAAPRVLLTTEALLSQWSDVGPQPHVLCVEQLELFDESAEAPVSSGLEANHLAYVIYTSGSTGRPKGAMNTHRAIVNRLLWMQETYGLTASDRVLQKTPYSFDVSVWEFFWPLITGATLVMARPGGHQETDYLLKLIVDVPGDLTWTMHFVPSMLAALLEEPGVEAAAGKLRRVICSGEALSADLMERFFTRLPGVELHNLYGPTEAAVDVTAWRCERREDGRVPLGGPVANTRMYVLDGRHELVGVGITGELYIGGVQVGRGYLKRPALTAERFVPDPFSAEPGARMYRTGDVGRWLEDGELEYLGRADQQVKIRGQRIELGEIEAALRDCDGVRDAAVVVSDRADGEKRLVGYLLTQTAAMDQVREYLRARLPEYMVPSVFMRLDELPLTPSGKLDRRALPAPESINAETVNDHVAPCTPVEELLAQIFAEVLKVEKVGTDDSFFDLGGHSLLATKVVSRVREAFRVEVTLRSLFERPTVAEFARHLEACLKAGKTTTPPIKRIERDGASPLSFAQQRLWFFEQLQPGTTTYNLLQSVRLLGALNVSALERSLNEILKRHESLRTTFQNINGEPVQQVEPASPLTLPLTDLSDLPESDREAEVRRLSLEELNRPFDLARGPLVRARLLKLDADMHVALFMMHHIVTDAWSMSVLLRELKVLYEAFSADRPTPLAELPVQYADFAHWQREWLSGEALEQQLSYWQERLAGDLPVLTLPADKPRPDVWTYRGAKHSVEFSKELTEEIKAFGNRQGATLFMTLLAAFQVLLHYYTGEEDIVVGTDDANRGRLETEPLIGFFINQLALRTDLSGNPSFKDLLGRVREVTLGAYANHDLPFDKIVERLRPERSLAHAPIFQVKLVLQNTPVEELELHGLKLQALQMDYAAAKFDLTPLLWEKPEGLRGWFEYSSDLFSAAAITRIAEQFEVVLKSVAARPDLTLEQLREVLAEDDRERRARAQREREESQRSRFKSIKPKAVSLSEQTIMQSELVPGVRLPLVVQPAANKLDLEEWTRTNLDFIETKLQKHGAILFRGFDVNSPSVFEGFAHAICPTLFDENGEHNRGSVSGKIYTPVAYPANKLLLWHNENSFNDAWPMKIWFCCATPAAQGGETPLVDSRRVFEMLDPKIRERFIEKKVMYVRNYKEGLGQSWQAIMRASNRAEAEEFCRKNRMEFEWKEGNGLLTRCVRPAVARHPRTGEMVWFNQAQHWHRACLDAEARESLRALFGDDDFPRDCYYGDGSVIEESVMEEILEVYRQLEVSFPWQAKDVVMLDNMLTAHGRNPYVGERKLYVAMGEMTSYAEVLAAEAGSLELAERA